jgi:hypothetical protein
VDAVFAQFAGVDHARLGRVVTAREPRPISVAAAAKRSTTEQLAAALEGRYRIGRELGMGGMATQYLAHDIRHERRASTRRSRFDRNRCQSSVVVAVRADGLARIRGEVTSKGRSTAAAFAFNALFQNANVSIVSESRRELAARQWIRGRIHPIGIVLPGPDVQLVSRERRAAPIRNSFVLENLVS